jgi:hypothetical protein
MVIAPFLLAQQRIYQRDAHSLVGNRLSRVIVQGPSHRGMVAVIAIKKPRRG